MAETIRRLSADRSSGDLEVRSGKIVKTVFFDHGRIVFAASNMKKDRLGEALMAVGRITDEEYERATALMRDRRRRFGEALVDAGVMDKNEVGRSVARQVKRVVLSLFEFREGAAQFDERKCPIPLEYMVSLSVHRVLYIGIKSMKSPELVEAALGNLDRWVTLAPVPPFRFGVRKCSAEELDILEQAHRRVTLRRLAWEKGGLSFSRLRSVYALFASGVLEPADRPEGGEQPAPVIQMETSTFLLSALRTRPDPSAREALRQEVDDELQRSARLDRETWLKVSRTAPRDDLIKALEDKMERYHALLEAVSGDSALKTDIELILGRASTMLRLARQAPPPTEPPPPPPGTITAPISVPASALASSVATLASPAAPPESAAAPKPGATAAPAVAARASGPAAAAAEAPAAASAPPPEHRAPEPSQDQQRIQQLLMEGHLRMTVADYGNAVKDYAALVDLAPNTAAYRLRLAIAMACWPRTRKQAEREFLEACRLDPTNADLHYQFGLYYKAMKVKSRAIGEMQTAVRLSPRHKEARQELEALSPHDSALSNLRKLFR